MEPLRPSDHVDSVQTAEPITQPKLGFVGYVRFFWRQLTSMRTALMLLLLLALGAIPGSLVPQRSSDPNGVVQYKTDHPDLFPVLDWFQLFDVYSSAWFSAIYLLLFISLVGCIIPRTKHHWQALKARPPKTPVRLQRLAGYTENHTTVDPETALDDARTLLRKQRYRVERYGTSLSAERGYLRETGNLVFHAAMVGLLFAVGIVSGFGYNGQKVIVEGQSFTNVLANYDSFNPGRFFSESELVPYSLTLDSFTAEYGIDNTTGAAVPLDYAASVTATIRGEEPQESVVKVNEPMSVGNNVAYLLGNGYAPIITVYDGNGNVAFSQAVPFLPQDGNLTSVGVVKVPDALPEQLGLVGFFYPWAADGHGGALASAHPEPGNPLLTLNVFTGDLGLDSGVPKSVYELNTDDMTQVAGGETDVAALELAPGESVDLPNGLGKVEFTELRRFVSLDIHDDPSQAWVLVFAILILAGLGAALFVPRRRLWVKATQGADGATRLEYAGLARGEDPTLDAAVDDFARQHTEILKRRMPS
ncbi:cytochrome c biogenesis protein ResB [Diaminobutyricimonas sp. TR449]|uniref:cytochrome c biogenesis protein ResB n=1 Tax=Diaminobutyricimonas sp. TR449 TaxID=2708076 RepID=UPI00141F160B|nr:cytochrome c biogenesis protein ResB [Diaminobutyricimonas sp. TR449]